MVSKRTEIQDEGILTDYEKKYLPLIRGVVQMKKYKIACKKTGKYRQKYKIKDNF